MIEAQLWAKASRFQYTRKGMPVLCTSMKDNKATDSIKKNFSTLTLSWAAPEVSGAQEAKKHGNDESPI